MSELDSEVTPTVQTLSMVKKHKIGLFLHDGTKYRRVKKSQTLTLSMNRRKQSMITLQTRIRRRRLIPISHPSIRI